jgi:DNA-binding IclR family transcriptional regulator
MLAFLPEPAREGVLSERLVRLTPNTPTDPYWLREELERVREEGMAYSAGEWQPGSYGLAAPLFDSRGVVGSIGVCGPVRRLETGVVERYGAAVKAVSRQLSWELGSPRAM